MTETPHRATVIGAGKVAHKLAPWLKSNKVAVKQIYNRTTAKAGALAAEVGAQPLAEVADIDREVDMVIIAVSDDAIREVSDELPSLDAVIVHTSGTRPIDDLKKHDKRGVFYPLQTFTPQSNIDFQQIPICIEGNSREVEEYLKSCCIDWGTSCHLLNSDQRGILHIAAVVANNFTNHLWGSAFDLLKEHNIEPNILYPLMLETVRKATFEDPHEVQTGPAVRGDQQTIDRHLDKLKSDANLREIYRVLTESIAQTKRDGKL